ncbi:MAG TPA: aldo/keto reductase [Abditibacteriaceae bacterium]|nr:aldo/keto reductase [Abditibacteriaceae bacterium]
MLFTSLPDTSLHPSVLCLGTGGFGTTTRTDDALAMLDAFAEAGGNFADTAHVYAAWLPGGAGQSERTLGRWLRSRRPQNFIVGTKGGHPDLATMEISRLSPECLTRDVDESLERLQLERIDLYWLHRDDPAVPIAEIIESLNELRNSGRIGALGASNWTVARLTAANAYATRHNLVGFCASQIGWSLATMNSMTGGFSGTLHMDEEMLDWHRRSKFPVAAYSAQANGFFAAPLPPAAGPRTTKQETLARSYLNPENAARHARAGQLAKRLGRTTNEVALAYIWSQTFPTVAIIGPRTPEQLAASLRAHDLRLADSDVAFLEGR